MDLEKHGREMLGEFSCKSQSQNAVLWQTQNVVF